jgi:type IV secretion system protein VirB7
MRNVIIGVFLAISLSACTTAGPYVTNISSDGNGGLSIEKCGVKMNAFMGTISTSDCTAQNIKISK